MPNPRPRCLTTGRFDNRDDLRHAVAALRGVGFDWVKIGAELDVSARTAKRVHEETEALRKEAREFAYRLAADVKKAEKAGKREVSTLPRAVKTYLIAAAILIIVALVIVLTR